MSYDTQAEAELIVDTYGNAIGDTWQELVGDLPTSEEVTRNITVSDEADQVVQKLQGPLIEFLATAIDVDDWRQCYIATGSQSALDKLYEAEHQLHEALSALRAAVQT